MPIVTISRMYGAGGSEVAARVAGLLGWSLLDNALVDSVAQRLGVTVEEVQSRQERRPSLAQRLADAMALGSPQMLVPADADALPPNEERMLEVTRRVIDEAVARGPVVIVGRGAQASLESRSDALHVFCYAPRAALVARAMRRDGLSEHDAGRIVDETNREREQYVRRLWNRSWSAHQNYHLCVNTDWLGVDGAATLVAGLARERLSV